MHALEQKGYHSYGNDVQVKYKGKWYSRKVRWHDLGNYEGYPYVILKGKKYGLKEW